MKGSEMIKKVVVVTGLVAMVAFSGCSSDTKESLKAEKQELEKKCGKKAIEFMNNEDDDGLHDLQEDCREARIDIKARLKALKESGK